MIYVISKSTCGKYNVRDIQCNANWDCCPYSDYALIPNNLVDGILATKGYCDIKLNSAGTEVTSFTARTIPDVPEECCGKDITATAPQTVSGSSVSIDDSGELPLMGLKLYGKTTQDGTPTPESPVELESVGASGNIGVTVLGKNLIDENGTTLYSGYFSDSTGVRVSGNSAYICFMITKLVKPNTTYTLSCNLGIKSIWFRDDPVENISKVTGGTGQTQLTFTTPNRCNRLLVSLYNTSGSADTVAFEWAQLEVGDTATTYEPYKVQTLTAKTPNGLPGIGDVRDETDFARGVYVQRFGSLDMGSLNWEYAGSLFRVALPRDFKFTYGMPRMLCDRYIVVHTGSAADWVGYNDGVIGYRSDGWLMVKDSRYTDADTFKTAMSGVMLLYALAEENPIPLSAEEIAQYSALHTNKPNTTVFNDAGAEMEITYCTPNTAVPMNMGSGNAEKVLITDEHGCVVPVPFPCIESKEHPGCYYRMVGEEKEWLNPPMIPNVEYRTTERRNGNPVYTQLFSVSGFAGKQNVALGNGYHSVVRVCADASYGTYHLKVNDSQVQTKIESNAGYVYIEVDMGTETCTACNVHAWYV